MKNPVKWIKQDLVSLIENFYLQLTFGINYFNHLQNK